MKVDGDKALTRMLRTLPDRMQRKVLRASVSKGGTPIMRRARQLAPQETGLLAKSMGKKVVTHKPSQSVTAIIGPRRDVRGEHNGKPRVPANYAHLVEFGHIAPDGSHVPAQPFMRPAFDTTQAQALGIVRQGIADGVVKEARRLAK